jgi:hypothetical protein
LTFAGVTRISEEGSREPAANPTRMSEHDEPHVSGEELRAALARNGRSRPNPVMTDDPPAWEWTTDEQVELVELRAATHALEGQIEELRQEAEAARGRERALRDGLKRLAAARMWHRRAVVEDLGARGLL